jgi:hypothetical protein
MTTYYKATRPDGRDFHTGRIDYAKALADGATIKHKLGKPRDVDARHYLSVATVPGDCTGMTWPCRLFEVEAVGYTWAPHPDTLPNKVAALEVRVIRELPAETVFGSEAPAIVALLDTFEKLTTAQRDALYKERWTIPGYSDAYRRVAIRTALAGRVGLGAARHALRARLFNRDGWYVDYTACGAALAVLLRPWLGKGLTKKDYELLTRPWRKVVGAAHPDDKLKVASK